MVHFRQVASYVLYLENVALRHTFIVLDEVRIDTVSVNDF